MEIGNNLKIENRQLKIALFLLSAALLACLAVGCKSVDPAPKFIARVDNAPPERRPKGWENVRPLMLRPAPVVGQTAPDFTLPVVDGTSEINRLAYQGTRPLVLIFASFT